MTNLYYSKRARVANAKRAGMKQGACLNINMHVRPRRQLTALGVFDSPFLNRHNSLYIRWSYTNNEPQNIVSTQAELGQGECGTVGNRHLENPA